MVGVTKPGRRHGASRRHFGGGANLGVLGSLETGMGDKEDGHGAEGKLSHDQLLTNPDEGGQIRQGDPGRCGWRSRWAPSHGAYKFSRKPDGDILAMKRDRGNPPQAAEHASGDARAPRRCRRNLQEIINSYGGKMKPTLGRAGVGDPARHQERACARSTSTPTTAWR